MESHKLIKGTFYADHLGNVAFRKFQKYLRDLAQH